MTARNYCDCRDCKIQKRKGKILGAEIEGAFRNGVFGWCVVSAYVNFPKFRKGKRVRRSKMVVDSEVSMLYT